MYKECITVKRLLLLILCAVMTFSAFSLALSEGQPCEDGFYYEVLADGNARITGYDYSVLPTTATLLDVRGVTLNPAYDVVIPSEIGGHTVTEAVIEPALWAYTFIPETVTRLEVRMPAEKDLSARLVRIDPEYARIGLRRLTDTACWRTTDGQIDTGIDPYERIGVEIDENNPVYIEEDGLVYDKTGNTLVFAANSAKASHISEKTFKPIRVKDGTKRIGDYAFANCITGTVIVLPESVTEYGTDCFPHGTGATKLPVSVMYSSMYFGIKDEQTLTLSGWNQGDYSSKLCKMLAQYCGSETVVVVPTWNMYVYTLPEAENKVIEAVIDPNSFTGLYIPSTVTNITFKPAADEDKYGPCLIGTDDNEYYSVRETEEPQLIFIENDHPVFSVRNGMLYDKSGETLIYCPRRGNTVSIPEGTKKVLKNAFLAWPAGTLIAAEDSVEWEEQILRDDSAPIVVSLADYSPRVITQETWTPEHSPQYTSHSYWFPKKSGTDLYQFEYINEYSAAGFLSVSGNETADDISYKCVSAENSDEVHLERVQQNVLYRIPYAISEERFEYFIGLMDSKSGKMTKKLYSQKVPEKMLDFQLEELCPIYPALAEGKTIYIPKEDLSTKHFEYLEGYFSQAGYTEEDWALDMAGVNLPGGGLDYSLSCTVSRKYEGRNLISSFSNLSLTSQPGEKCEYITLNPRLGAGIPAASGFVYMPQMLVENAQYHASDAEDRWDWWYADLDAGVNDLPVYSQQVPDGIYVCTVTSDMPLRVRVPADMTYLSTAAGEYARVQIITDENGNASGNVTVRYRFIPNEP